MKVFCFLVAASYALPTKSSGDLFECVKPTQGQRPRGYNGFTYVTGGAVQRVAGNDKKNGAELLNAALGTSWDLAVSSNAVMYGSMFSENCKADITAVNDALGGSMPWECNSALGNGLRNGVLSNCTQESVDMLNAFVDEKQSYIDFYIAASVLVGLIVCCGLFQGTGGEPCDECCTRGYARHTVLVLIFGVRSYDMFSDWAFFSISLRKKGAFAAQGGDPDQIWIVSLTFCILGSLLWLPDLWGFSMRVKQAAEKEKRAHATYRRDQVQPAYEREADAIDSRIVARITACVFLCEDLPQLVLNAGIYLPTVGIEDADPIAILSLTMSGLSIMLNCMLFWREVSGSGKGTRTDEAIEV